MKLTKLLPITTIAGVAAIVTPLVTSCSQKGTTIIWKEGDPTPLDPAKAEEFIFDSQEDLTIGYFDEISKNKTLLSQDLVTDYVNTVTDLELGTPISAQARTDMVDKENHKISYDSEYTYKYNGTNLYWTFSVKNVEHQVLWDVTSLTDATLEPKLLVLTDTAWLLKTAAETLEEEGAPQDLIDAAWALAEPEIKKALDYADELVKDHGWSLTCTTNTISEILGRSVGEISETIDYKNVYEYVSLIFYSIDSEYAPYLTLRQYAIKSAYFANAWINL